MALSRSSPETSEFSDRIRILSQILNNRKRLFSEDVGAAKALVENISTVRSRIDALVLDVESLEKVSGVLTSIGESRQAEVQEQIEHLVTQGLHKIFGDHLSFHVVQSVRANAPVVDFFIKTEFSDGSSRETSLSGSMGGGICAVTGFLLRLVVLMLSQEESFLVLDETFAHVSDQYVPLLAEFVREVVDKSNVQVLMITHQKEFTESADKVYTFSLDSQGHTVVECI